MKNLYISEIKAIFAENTSLSKEESMEKYLEPTKDQVIMGFIASCIESVADRMNVCYREIFERMEKVGMIDEYIYPCYEQLHSESRENLTDSLIDTLNRWEEDLNVSDHG